MHVFALVHLHRCDLGVCRGPACAPCPGSIEVDGEITSVCNGHGTCNDKKGCMCAPNYEGFECSVETFKPETTFLRKHLVVLASGGAACAVLLLATAWLIRRQRVKAASKKPSALASPFLVSHAEEPDEDVPQRVSTRASRASTLEMADR